MPEGWGCLQHRVPQGWGQSSDSTESMIGKAGELGAGHWLVEAAMAEKGGPGGCEAAPEEVWISTGSSALATQIQSQDTVEVNHRGNTLLSSPRKGKAG